jgi:hypothetical protein
MSGHLNLIYFSFVQLIFFPYVLMAKKLSSPKKKKTIPTSKVAAGPMSSVPPTGASTAVEGMPGNFLLRPTHAHIQALPQADRFVPTVVLVGNKTN